MTKKFSLVSFEASSHGDDSSKFWDAHEFMRSLGYQTWASFEQVVNKAMASCAQLGISIGEAFVPDVRMEAQKRVVSYRLSRFACFLVTMHGDSNKVEVAQAKAVLAAVADALIQEQVRDHDLARLESREDLKHAEKMVCGVARDAGLDDARFGLFKDAGFRGMYNMSLRQLKSHKHIDEKAILYDFMGLTELAGNLFRVTQTAERIKSAKVRGSESLIQTAQSVGSEVRTMMQRNSGAAPESLTIEENISTVKNRLKATNREMRRLDTPRKRA